MKEKVLIVGSGKWGTKITEILNDSFSCTNMPASVVSENPKRYFSQDAFIWFCTSTPKQFEILDFLINQESKIYARFILEKPFTLNETQHGLILHLLERKDLTLFLSSPWSYSELWEFVRTRLFSSRSLVSIEILRGGPERRSFASPSQDWLIHDLMLLAELEVSFGEFSMSKQNCPKNSELKSISGQFSSGIKVKLVGGFMNERQATWTIHEWDKVIIVDFLQGQISETDKQGKITDFLRFNSKSSIRRMLLAFVKRQQSVDLKLRIVEFEKILH